MIGFDTNALVRMVVEDDKNQARAVQNAVQIADENSIKILILSEVLIETIWVLESVYKCTRDELGEFLDNLLAATPFTFSDPPVVRNAISQYKEKGDFADLMIVGQARKQGVEKLFSFDKKLQKRFPGYVVETLDKDVLKVFT